MSLILLTVIAGVIAQVLGWAWHGPLFGKKWMQAQGGDMANPPKMSMKAMAAPLIINFIANLFMAFLLFNLLGAFGAFSVKLAIRTTTIIFVGLILPIITTQTLWNGRPTKSKWTTFWISVGFQVVNLLIWSILFALVA